MCTSIHISFFVFIVLNKNYFGCIQIILSQSRYSFGSKDFLRVLCPLKLLLGSQETSRTQRLPPSSIDALNIVYKKLTEFFFHTLLTYLFEQRYFSSVTSYNYLSNLIREVNKHLFKKYYVNVIKF